MDLPTAPSHLALSKATFSESAPPKTRKLRRGFMIVFEGIDGVGKTTQARLLNEHLQKAGYEVVSLKEPTDGPWGQRISQLARQGRKGIAPETELEWFLQDRRENVEQNIRPALQKRQVVLLDRYYFSTMAYQGALGYDPEVIRARNETFAPVPDLLFLLELPPVQALQRVQQRNRPNQFEQQQYLERVAEILDTVAEMDFPYLRRISAALTPEAIHAHVWQEVQAALIRLQEN
jgi:dTMP kinase